MSDSPGLCRVFRHLRDAGPATAQDLADACYVVKRHAHWSLNRLHELGLVHIKAWRKQFGEGSRGRPHIAVWVYGHGTHAPKPAPELARDVQVRRANRLRRQHGEDVARKILASRRDNGASVIVVDGEVVYRRQSPRGVRRAA